MPDIVSYNGRQNWEVVADKYCKQLLARIPKVYRLTELQVEDARNQERLTGAYIDQFLEKSELKVLGLDSSNLVYEIACGAISAAQAAQAYCHSASVAHQINPCLLEIMFQQAEERARVLDSYFEKYGRTIGPLHGLPISLKDQFHVRGVGTTLAYVGWINTFEGAQNPELTQQVQSQLVDELLALGAIVYCKTSLAQTLLFDETENNIIGQTLNPINMRLSPGGSSGGEGALIAMKGSSLGVGTDTAGSIRVPAAFCGLYGVKPTHDRFSYKNVANTNPGQLVFPSSVGFISSSMEGLRLIMESILSLSPWIRDPDVISRPWNDEIVQQFLGKANDATARPHHSGIEAGKLRFAIMYNDKIVTPHPPITRALVKLKELLRAEGHMVSNWEKADLPSHACADTIHQKILAADGAHHIHTQLDLSGEPLIPQLRESPRMQLKDPMGLLEYQALGLEAINFCDNYTTYWNEFHKEGERMVDAVVMPVAPLTGIRSGQFFHLGYTEPLNLLDYTVMVIPITTADRHVDVKPHGFQPLNADDALNMSNYDAELYHDTPVAVQIVCRKYEEEKCWAIARVVADAVGRNPKAMF